MAVTLPSAAGLGASGACIVHDSKTRAAEMFAFPPIAAPGPINGVSIMVPTGVRAITLMHIRHGQARWEFDVAPAERMARVGVPVSRALSRDLQAGAAFLGADREARRIFGKGSGTAVTEGDTWAPGELAGTLGALRQRGGVDFFQGSVARLLSDQVAQMGGSLPLESLRGALPVTGVPVSEGYAATVSMSRPRRLLAPARSRDGVARPHRPPACRPIRAASPASRRWTRRAARRPVRSRWASSSAPA